MRIPGQRVKRTRLIQTEKYVVAVEVEMVIPSLPGIAELTGRRLSAAEVAGAVAEHLARATGWAVEADDWFDAERQRLQALRAGKYATERWNRKR